MWRTLQQTIIIVLVGATLGLVANTVSPRRIPWITPPKPVPKAEELLGLEQARELWNGGQAIFLDARSPDDFLTGHIANAWNLPAEAFEQHFPQVASMLTPEMPIVVYCDGAECDLSHHLTDKLKQLGFPQARILTNGWTLWSKAGLPTETGPRQ